MVAVRHAPRAVGAPPGLVEIFRSLLRNVAAVDSEPRGPEVVARLGTAGQASGRSVSHPDAPAHATHDEAPGVPGRAPAGGRRAVAAQGVTRNVSSVTGGFMTTSSSLIVF